ncbi:phloem protein 2-like protein, partial [Tanacetum coccineum]
MVENLEQRQEDEDNSKMENLKHLKIPFKEIFSATNGFADSRMIGWGGFGGVYRAELFHVDVRKYVGKIESLVELYGYPRRKDKVALKRREITSDQGRKEFWKEIDVLSGLNHQNIISLVGFCYEYGEMIIIYDYASKGSFEKFPAFKYYCGEAQRGLCDPKYLNRGTVKDRASLVDMAECHLSNNEPLQIIGDYLRKDLEDEKFLDSVKTFAAITHECLHSTETQRLTMADVLKELKKALTFHLTGSKTISLEDVKSATNDFSKERVIGSGASGKIYKGELTFFKKSIPVAVKQLHRAHSYGEGAFLKEVVKLSRYAHENIITLRGFCEEGNEKIIILDYAINKSLDMHLSNSSLTWGLRLKISIGAAKGLNHIHSFEEDQKTVHGDINSGNILLDHDWKATISDFIVSKSQGTLGYVDPQYSLIGATKESDVYSFGVVLFELLSGRLAIEKVEKYSHPTLREIIDAGDEVKDKKVVFLAWMAARCFEEKKQRALIFDDIKEKTDVRSVDIVSKVAYKCLQKDQEKRPTMALVIQELEKAFDIHVEWEFKQRLPTDNLQESALTMEKWYAFKVSIDEFNIQKLLPVFTVLRLSNDSAIRLSPTPSKTDIEATSSTMAIIDPLWLSLNKDGKVKEMISATKFSYENCWSFKLKVLENSRFGTVAKISNTQNLKIPIKIKTQFLSLGIIYGAYLVFRFCDPKTVSSKPYVDLKYKTASGKLNSYIAERRDGEWMMIELCRFRSHNQVVDFEIQLKSFCGHPCGSGPIFVDGIEFRPIDN